MTLQNLLDFTGRIELMDIGAACINETPVYRKLLDQGLAHLNAFEGDARQIEKIRATFSDKATVYPDFLGDGQQHMLRLAHPNSGMTSLLAPDPKVLAFFNGFEEIGAITGTETVQTKRLDEIAGLPRIDFIKMDIQGSELSVLQHGTRVLRDVLALQLEVSFIALYQNQPTFGEVDVWLRAQGFLPHCFVDVKKWSIAPTKRDGNPRRPFNQLMEADIVYIRDPFQLADLSDDQLRKQALIAHHCFASYDLCVHVMLELIRRGALAADTPQRYFDWVNRQNPPAQPAPPHAFGQSFSTPLRPLR